jgi:hypothetical protein
MPSHPPAAFVSKDSQAIFLNTFTRDFFPDTKLFSAELPVSKLMLRNIAAMISWEPLRPHLLWPSMMMIANKPGPFFLSNSHDGWTVVGITTMRQRIVFQGIDESSVPGYFRKNIRCVVDQCCPSICLEGDISEFRGRTGQ